MQQKLLLHFPKLSYSRLLKSLNHRSFLARWSVRGYLILI